MKTDIYYFSGTGNSLSVAQKIIDRIEKESYLLIDDRLFYEFNERMNLFLEATNLTNQQYTEVMTPMPGRWIRAGVNLQIGQ